MGKHSEEIQRSRKSLRCKDRLSSLPDPILIDILSLIPFNCALATSILSHRWQYLWTHITSFKVIHYKYELGFLCYDEKFKQLTSPSIFRFQLSLNGIYDKDIISLLDGWILDVCARNVEIIKVCALLKTDLKLPMCVFHTKSLVKLDIKNLISFNLPDRVNLPNLKNLSIKGHIYVPSITLFEMFINSCPPLEDLYFEFNFRTTFSTELNFIVPNLKRLDMKWEYACCNIVIDAPNLEYFVIDGPLRFGFVETPKALLEVQLRHYKDDNVLVSNLVEFISQSVRCLGIDCVPRIGSPERLSYLTCLELEIGKPMDFEKLMKVLEVSPALKILRLKMNGSWSYTDYQIFKEYHFVQYQTSVNTIEVEIMVGDLLCWNEKDVVNMIENLLRSASKDLKQLTIIMKYWYGDIHIPSMEKHFVQFLMKLKQVRNYEIDCSMKDYYCWSFVAWF